jgi:transposase
LPKRWIVERTLGRINRARRLAKDFETLIASSLAWVLLIRRIARYSKVAT